MGRSINRFSSIELVSEDLIKQLRDLIKYESFRDDIAKWLRLTASLNVLTDSTWAVKYYCSAVFPEDGGGKYLYIFGLLQALYLQQNTISGIFCSLFGKGINFKIEYPDVYEVRDLRNDVAGHPEDADYGKSFVYLIQTSLEKDSFAYNKILPDHASVPKLEGIGVDVVTKIEIVSKRINVLLREAIGKLEA